MRQYTYTTTTDLPADRLFEAIVDVERWPQWDDELEWTRLAGEPRVGTKFSLKPKGGPKTAMEITGFDRPGQFSDVAHLPLAKMRTDHQFEPHGGVTRVTVQISISGPLAFFWDRVVARKQADGAEAQTAAFFTFARGEK